jgi:hypothetical protein
MSEGTISEIETRLLKLWRYAISPTAVHGYLGNMRRFPHLRVMFEDFLKQHADLPDDTPVVWDKNGVHVGSIERKPKEELLW